MSSIYTKSGIKKRVDTGTKKSVILKVNSTIYKKAYMEELDTTAKNVLNGLLKYMNDDTNLIQIGGDTLTAIMSITEYHEETIRKAMVRLNKAGLAEKTNLRGEYIVNPRFAVKGKEDKVWEMYSKIENDLRDKNVHS